MTESPPTTFHFWSDLPNDIKEQILSVSLTKTCHAHDAYVHWEYCEESLFPLTGARNRAIGDLAQKVYCETNWFHVDVFHPNDVQLPPRVFRPIIQNLYVNVDESSILNTIYDMLFRQKDS
jgi:hypothetical protein